MSASEIAIGSFDCSLTVVMIGLVRSRSRIDNAAGQIIQGLSRNIVARLFRW